MERHPGVGLRRYRVGSNVLVAIGIFAGLFATLGIIIGLKQSDWTFLEVVVGSALALFLLLQVLRLEIGPDGFRYRNLSGTRVVDFTEVSRAYIDVIRSEYAPQGVARFWVERRDRGRIKINLRTFPVQAAADLFTALEMHGIHIEVPDEWAARRMVDQTRAAQHKR
jgi:hypothetical protein